MHWVPWLPITPGNDGRREAIEYVQMPVVELCFPLVGPTDQETDMAP
jgi:hypothetical protein